MKIRSFFYAAAAALVMSSCARVSETTVITGTADLPGLEQVAFSIPNVIDTLVPVVDGKFSVELPVHIEDLARLEAASSRAVFVSDGTPLTIVLSDQNAITSKYPKISLQERFNSFVQNSDAIGNSLTAKYEEIEKMDIDQAAKDSLSKAAYDEVVATYVDHNKKYIKENGDNIISVYALSNLRGTIDEVELVDLIETLSDKMKQHSFVQSLSDALKARTMTAEGSMFVDFEDDSVTGYTKSKDPQPIFKHVKFSEFVGNGKYVLVDFWSPWCGPCKREIPNIKAVYDKYHGKDFDVLSIAVWERQSPKVTLETAAELGINWKQITNAMSIPTEIYGIEGIPHIMLIGPDGTILKRGLHGDSIEAEVAKYVKPVK
jgi:thiol-disulfide isomerase/thioredoxin